MNLAFRLILAALAICGLSAHTSTAASQKPSVPVAWYIPPPERSRLYERTEITANVFRPNPQTQTLVSAFWVTPDGARAIVSYNIDHETINSATAEERVNQLRPADRHLILVRINGVPEGAERTRIAFRLATPTHKPGVEGTLLSPSFAIPGVDSREKDYQGYLVSFPKHDSTGALLVEDVNVKLDIRIEYLGQTVHLRSKASRFAKSLADL